MNTEQHTSARRVGEVFLAFLRLGVTSFGGPIAHLGFFREDLVDKRKWVSEQQNAEFIAISQFLPGPASSQVGFAIGLSRAGYRGALAAWTAFTLPSAVLMVLFAFGAAQALPGPLFSYAAYLGAEMGEGASAALFALLALGAIFLPGMLLMVAALPFWGALSTRPQLRAAVNGANAAVVGILAAVLVNPIITSTITGVVPLIIALVCLTMLAVLKWPSWSVVLVGASSGAVFAAFGLLG